MKYIRIYNDSNLVNRLALEKLGLSTKRNDPSSIGQFGSGIKFAPISALRKNIKWIFAGEDSNGKYMLEYVSHLEDGIDSIYYNYLDENTKEIVKTKPSSFTLDAGCLSWEDNFQIIREAIANAVDGAKEFGGEWGYDIVEENNVVSVPGKFCVYLSATPDILEIINNFDKYFAFDRESLLSGYYSDIYDKVDDVFRVYCKGVLVYENENIKSLFDYDLHRAILNEERKIRSEYEIEFYVAKCIHAASTYGNKDLMEKILSTAMGIDSADVYEFNKVSATCYMNNPETISTKWVHTYYDKYKGLPFIYIGELSINAQTAIREKGYEPTQVLTTSAYQFLKSIGVVLNIKDIISQEQEFDLDYKLEKYPNLVTAIEIVCQFEKNFDKSVVSVFEPKNFGTFGLTINMDQHRDNRKILISRSHCNSDVVDIICTLIHEFDHFWYGIGDGNDEARNFRQIADERSAKLMFKFYQENLCNKTDNGIEFTIKDLGKLGGVFYTAEYNELLSGYVLQVGSKRFVLETQELIETDKKAGVAIPIKDGSSFEINLGISDFNIKKLEV
jgi:hypothetical protein